MLLVIFIGNFSPFSAPKVALLLEQTINYSKSGHLIIYNKKPPHTVKKLITFTLYNLKCYIKIQIRRRIARPNIDCKNNNK